MNFPCTVYNRVAADFDANYPRTVQNQEELDKLGPGWFDDPVQAAAWEPPKMTGPTFEEYTKAGYSPDSYPPVGYAERDTAGLRDYRAALASADAAQDKARKIADDREVKEAEKAAAKSVLDAKILKAMEANDAAAVAQLETEVAALDGIDFGG